MTIPSVTIIVAAKNSERTIEQTVSSILDLNYPNYDLVLVNDGSTDKTGEIMNRYVSAHGTGSSDKKNVRVTVMTTAGVGPSEARNMAVRKAVGDYVAFTDGDCIVDKEWINELLKGFQMQYLASKGIAGVGGDQLSPPDDTRFGKLVQQFMKTVGFMTDYIRPDKKFKSVDHNPTCNVMYKRIIFNEHIGFIKGLWPGEDVEFDYRIKKSGYVLVYNPSAIVYHYRVSTMKRFIGMMTNYGRVQASLVKMYGPFRKIQYVPLTLLTYLLIFFLLFKINIFFSIILLLATAVLLPATFFLAKTGNIDLASRFFVLFHITILFWNFGFLKGFFSKIVNKP
jgi:cellulose synthase/poly-beta-1,6-N-acetylglucosamine synthase-like glycosyltransferase